MTTVSEVREELAGIIDDNIEGLRGSAIVPDQMVGPIAVVSRRAFDPRYVFSGERAQYEFTVTIYTPRAADRAAQNLLDDWVELTGATSVIAAIQDGDNWQNVTVDYAQVVNVSEVQAVSVDTAEYLAVRLDVEVVW
jgi:hypothetical protein